MNKKTLKKEAMKRMKALGLLPEILEYFDKEDKLFISERQDSFFQATLYYLNDLDVLREINEFEENYGGLVYHVQLTHTTFGDMYSFLFVSKYDDEWSLDWENIKEEALAYVVNGDIKELGTIGIKPYMGGVARTW